MRQKEVEVLYAYFINYQTILEGDVNQLRQNVRYRNIDTVDCLELALALERLAAFKEFSKNVRALLNMRNCDFEEE